MRYINLTPHEITETVTGRTFPPSGEVARAETFRTEAFLHEGIPFRTVEYGEVEGVPSDTPGTVYIVSGLVRQALPSRSDLVSPGPLVRDDNGQPIGCEGFDINR